MSEGVVEKVCLTCNVWKPLTGFHKDNITKDKKTSSCKNCRRRQSAEWRKANMAQIRAEQTTYAAEHPNKKCCGCDIIFPLDNFYADNATRDGKTHRCKACNAAASLKWKRNNPEKARALHEKWVLNNPVRAKELWQLHRYKKFGITRADYEHMLRQQEGRCDVCKKEFFETPNIDHDHKTEKVRALLCRSCNNGLGNFLDDPSILLQAIEYLRRHQ